MDIMQIFLKFLSAIEISLNFGSVIKVINALLTAHDLLYVSMFKWTD